MKGIEPQDTLGTSEKVESEGVLAPVWRVRTFRDASRGSRPGGLPRRVSSVEQAQEECVVGWICLAA